MTSDDEIEQFFQLRGPQIVNLDARRATFATRGNLGCLLILLAAIGLFGFIDML